MVIDVFLKKNTRTFFRDQIRRTFWRKFHEFNNHEQESRDIGWWFETSDLQPSLCRGMAVDLFFRPNSSNWIKIVKFCGKDLIEKKKQESRAIVSCHQYNFARANFTCWLPYNYLKCVLQSKTRRLYVSIQQGFLFIAYLRINSSKTINCAHTESCISGRFSVMSLTNNVIKIDTLFQRSEVEV